MKITPWVLIKITQLLHVCIEIETSSFLLITNPFTLDNAVLKDGSSDLCWFLSRFCFDSVISYVAKNGAALRRVKCVDISRHCFTVLLFLARRFGNCCEPLWANDQSTTRNNWQKSWSIYYCSTTFWLSTKKSETRLVHEPYLTFNQIEKYIQTFSILQAPWLRPCRGMIRQTC